MYFLRDIMNSMAPALPIEKEEKKVEKKVEVDPVVEPDIPDEPVKAKK